MKIVLKSLAIAFGIGLAITGALFAVTSYSNHQSQDDSGYCETYSDACEYGADSESLSFTLNNKILTPWVMYSVLLFLPTLLITRFNTRQPRPKKIPILAIVVIIFSTIGGIILGLIIGGLFVPPYAELEGIVPPAIGGLIGAIVGPLLGYTIIRLIKK